MKTIYSVTQMFKENWQGEKPQPPCPPINGLFPLMRLQGDTMIIAAVRGAFQNPQEARVPPGPLHNS
jgi:hypothetical protein